jgi:hypothetical protein
MTIGFAQLALEEDLTDFMSTEFGYTNADFIDKLRWWGDYHGITYDVNIPDFRGQLEAGAMTPETVYFVMKQTYEVVTGP